MPFDAAIIDLNIPTMHCPATFTPSIELQNRGTTTLTSATISYHLDNNTTSTQLWTGSLGSGDSILITLPVDSSTTGIHTFTATSAFDYTHTD